MAGSYSGGLSTVTKLGANGRFLPIEGTVLPEGACIALASHCVSSVNDCQSSMCALNVHPNGDVWLHLVTADHSIEF
jgi:hypothetical protein